jgi:DNA relaxase NicK
MAQISELQIGLDVLIGAGSGVLGAMGAYYKLKARLDLQEAKNTEQERELEDIRQRKKEMNMALHKRIDDQNSIIADIQKEMNTGHNKLETAMAQMELRIVEKITGAINSLKN